VVADVHGSLGGGGGGGGGSLPPHTPDTHGSPSQHDALDAHASPSGVHEGGGGSTASMTHDPASQTSPALHADAPQHGSSSAPHEAGPASGPAALAHSPAMQLEPEAQ
jgi:hypothetical protein